MEKNRKLQICQKISYKKNKQENIIKFDKTNYTFSKK